MSDRKQWSQEQQRLAHLAFDLLEPCAPRMEKATAPVFRESSPGTLEAIGSAVLLNVADEPLVLSAAHVLDEAATGTRLYVGTHNSVRPLEGRWSRTRMPKSGRVDDPVDVGILRLPRGAWSELDRGSFLSVGELAPFEDLPEGSYAVVTGFPCRKQKWARHLGGETSFYTFTAACCGAEDYRRLGVDPSHAIVLGFDQERSWTREGQRATPRLEGVSGGGLWVLGRPNTDQKPIARLAGIFIEWRSGSVKRIVATRIEVLLSGIWGDWPDLRTFLPTPR